MTRHIRYQRRFLVPLLILLAITSVGFVKAHRPQKPNPETSMEYNSKGELVKVEKTRDNDGRLIERKESDPNTGKVRKRITYKYLKGFKEPDTSETRYGPDGTTVTGTTNIDHDKDGEPTSTSTTEYDATGKETGGSKRERDGKGKERCYNWNSAKQAYEEVECTKPWVSGLSRNDSAPSKKNDGQVVANGGLQTVVFDNLAGTLRLNLPDDMRAGDTISGTVVLEPKGGSSEEKERNRATLEGYVIDVGGKNVSPKQDRFTIQPIFDMVPSKAIMEQTQKVLITISNPADANSQPATSLLNFPAIEIRNPNHTETFLLPSLGQQGRPLEIFGPFDGSFSNTTVRFGPASSTVQDFENDKRGSVSGGFGVISPLAESPRKVVFLAPVDTTGSTRIFVKEGEKTSIGSVRNLGIGLSAPKTSLMRGEKTTVTVEVRGLEGITNEVPLQLNSKGVITMEGGNVQNLRIKPPEVRQDGHYTTTREIIGQQTGGFTVTATVLVRPFDFCIQDDSRPSIFFLLNSVTGDYLFECPGCAGPPSGTEKFGQVGGTQPGTLTGTGKAAIKGCMRTLTHNAPDRRVFATLDACTRTGEASVEFRKTRFTIRDRNITDNTCGSPPPK